jgi:hypothetical protein
MPPLYCRLSTLIVKVARPWAGIVGGVPHGVTHSQSWGGVPGFLCAVLPEVFYHAEIAAYKKGGVDELGKLREQF